MKAQFYLGMGLGVAAGAAAVGCSAQMIGFAVISFRENKVGGLVSQGLGTSMLQMGNIVKNPRVWIAPTLASAITGPVATCVFRMEMNGAPISSGMASTVRTPSKPQISAAFPCWKKSSTEGNIYD